MSRTTQRGSRLALVLAVIGASAVLVAVPGFADVGNSGPLDAIDFVAAWTNDDGKVNVLDVGDDGAPSSLFDAWPDTSSSDPTEPGFPAGRAEKDVAVCTAEVRFGDPDHVDVVVDNAYPQYVCTITTVIENASGFPAEVILPSVIEADDGLVVQLLGSDLPELLGPGQQAEVSYWVRVLNEAPQHTTLTFTVRHGFESRPCDTTIYGIETITANLHAIDLTTCTATLIATLPNTSPSNSFPNSLATDPATGRLFYADQDGTAWELWVIDPADPSYHRQVGTVPGPLADAAWYDGAYHYVVHGGNQIYRVPVSFDGADNPVMGTPTVVDTLGHTYYFGDIAITDGGWLYGSARFVSPKLNKWFTVDLSSPGSYTIHGDTGPVKYQLAFDGAGRIIGTFEGLSIIDPSDGSIAGNACAPFGFGFADLSCAECPESPPPPTTTTTIPPSTTTTIAGPTTTTTVPPSTTTTIAGPTTTTTPSTTTTTMAGPTTTTTVPPTTSTSTTVAGPSTLGTTTTTLSELPRTGPTGPTGRQVSSLILLIVGLFLLVIAAAIEVVARDPHRHWRWPSA